MYEIMPIYQVGPPCANDRESIMHVCTVDRSVPQEYNGRLPGAIGWLESNGVRLFVLGGAESE